jgi:ribosomal protein S3AE
VTSARIDGTWVNTILADCTRATINRHCNGFRLTQWRWIRQITQGQEDPETSDADNRSVQMKTLILSSAAAAALTLALATASAQTRLEGSGVATLTPEQQTAIRRVIRERLVDQARERFAQILESRVMLAEKLAEQATEAAKLTPEQQTAIRRVIREGLADQARERLAQRLEFRARLADAVAQQIRDRGAPSDTVGRGR